MTRKPIPSPPIPPTYALPRRHRLGPLGWVLVITAGIFLLGAGLCVGAPVYNWASHGILVWDIPQGDPLPQAWLSAGGLRRGYPGWVGVSVHARYTLGPADEALKAPIRRYRIRLYLVDGEGQETALSPEECWEKTFPGERMADVRLPEVPDGDYKLRAVLSTPVGPLTAEVDLPLYAPAVVHLASDRPLYKPGQTLMLRAVALRMSDLQPLEDRPGTFVVGGPDGVLLEENVPSGPWGIASTDFPLADDAPSGTYTATWRSGSAEDQVTLDVQAFVMPRFQVDVAPIETWYAPGAVPRLQGTVRYNSGAPVAGALVAVDLASSGPDTWPIPNEWVNLPDLTTDAKGAFSLDLFPGRGEGPGVGPGRDGVGRHHWDVLPGARASGAARASTHRRRGLHRHPTPGHRTGRSPGLGSRQRGPGARSGPAAGRGDGRAGGDTFQAALTGHNCSAKEPRLGWLGCGPP